MKYQVTLVRTSIAKEIIEVEAPSSEQARQLADEREPDLEWQDMEDSFYEITEVKPV